MAQVHLTLEDDILKDLMLGNREDAVSESTGQRAAERGAV